MFFLNFRGYESHIIVWGLCSFTVLDIKLIGTGMQKYVPMG